MEATTTDARTSEIVKDGAIPEAVVKDLIQTIGSQFSPFSLKDQHQNNLSFHWGDASVRLDAVFRKIEAQRQFRNLIEDYSVQQTTLEELFLEFARDQYPVREVKMGCCKKCLTCACCNC